MANLQTLIRFAPYDFKSPFNLRMAKVLSNWEGTPYKLFSQSPGPRGGTDCVRFVTGVLDDMEGVPRKRIPRHMADAAMHAPETSRAVMRELMRMYQYRELSPTRDGNPLLLEPTDILVMKPLGGGPGHGVVVGPGKLWHCTEISGVTSTGLHMDGMDFGGVLRKSWQ